MKKLINHTYLTLSVVLVSFASYPLLFYKDMVQLFDQPALLGSLFLILAITLYKNNKNKRWLLYLAVLISIGLGIGYASVVLLGIWFGLETIWLIKSSFSQKKDVIKKILTHDSLIALVVGIVWASSLLAYNIYNEAKIRNTSLQTVGIIDSAARRLGLNKDFNQIFSDDLNWLNFTTGQIERIADRAIPIGHRQLSSLKYLIIIPMIIIIPWFIRCNTYPRQMLFLLMSLFGIVWLFLMKNFAAFHSYTAMYYIGLILTFYAGLFSISFVKKYTTPLLIGCAILFFTSHYVAQRNHSYQAESVNDYTYDFDQIARIVPPKAKIFYPEGYSNLVPGVPYAVGFYLTQTYISPRETADYIISTDRNYQGPTLTSHNKKIFVFENQSE